MTAKWLAVWGLFIPLPTRTWDNKESELGCEKPKLLCAAQRHTVWSEVNQTHTVVSCFFVQAESVRLLVETCRSINSNLLGAFSWQTLMDQTEDISQWVPWSHDISNRCMTLLKGRGSIYDWENLSLLSVKDNINCLLLWQIVAICSHLYVKNLQI